MNFTIFGYPKTGKTTLFNILTGAKIELKTYEKGKKELNQRTCLVPDERLDKLWMLYPDKKKKCATIDFIDIEGVSFGEIKNDFYLSYLRKADGLAHVVRGFQNLQLPHPKGRVNPRDDIISMEEELILADLVLIESRLKKAEKELSKTKSAALETEKKLLERLKVALEEKKAIRELKFSPLEEKIERSFAFLTEKPLLHLINVDEKDIPLIENPEKIYPEKKKGVLILAFCGKLELEIMELEEEEKKVFLSEYGLKELCAPKFLRASYELLEAVTFFTVGKDEVRAWTIRKNTPALKAAGVIHSEIEKGFIKAEVISWEELLQHGSLQRAKEKAALRLEGKDYIVQDGDVIYFRFSI